MTTDALDDVSDYGEATVTSKGQITLPVAMRQALNIAPGDRVRFERGADGRIVMAARKRRSILDISRENAFSIGEKGRDLDKLIDEAVAEAMADKWPRGRGQTDP